MKASINLFSPTKPHDKQKEVLAALDGGERFIVLRAGRKWRKTSLLISLCFEFAFLTGLTAVYIAPNRIQAKNICWDDHVPRILDELTKNGVHFKKNEAELSIRLPSGGKVQLLGVENQEALRGISNWIFVAGDEYDDWEEDIWPTIIRPNLIVNKAPAILAGTPKGFRNLYRLENGGIFKPFHFTSMDNPDIDRKELADLEEEYKSQGMGAYRQEILAQYEKPEGTVYEEWDMDKQYIPLLYNPDLPLHLSWDFGVNDPTVILFLQPYGDELRLIDYYEASDANLKHFVDWITERKYKAPEFEAGDIAGRARTLVTGKSPISELRVMGHSVSSQPIPDIEQQVRNTHKTIPHLYVSSSNPRTERFRDCIINYRYPKKPTNIINQSNENPIHDEYSHALRALEYYCWNKRLGGVGGVGKTENRQKLGKTALIDMATGKQISMNMKAFETKSRSRKWDN